MHCYCSAFSGAYCFQGLVLYDSLKKTDPSNMLFIVCLDAAAYEILIKLKLDNLIVITVEQIESFFPDLKAVKPNRAMNEYAWTIKSSEMLYIFKNYPEVDKLIWLDGDVQMLASPDEIFEEWGNASIVLTEQYYTGTHADLITSFGRFQAGFIGISRDEEGLECLSWWRDKCIDWCYGYYEKGRWADQKYLDTIPLQYKNVCIIKSLGINMTPFIMYRLNNEQQKHIDAIDGQLFINGIKIVLYHYYGYRYVADNACDLCSYWMRFSSDTIENLYLPYHELCKGAIEEIEKVTNNYKILLERADKHITNYFDIKRNNAEAKFDIATIVGIGTIREALALYYSLQQNCMDFYWWVCCVDKESYDILGNLKLPNATVVFIGNLFDRNKLSKLKQAPYNNMIERLKAKFIHHILKNNYTVERLIYLDSKCFIYRNIADIFDRLQDQSSFIISAESEKKAKSSTSYSNDILGFKRCRSIEDFLEYCIDMPVGVFYLSEMMNRKLDVLKIYGEGYNCSLSDLLLNRLEVYLNGKKNTQQSISIFRFDSSNRNRDKAVSGGEKAKLYLKKDLYDMVYEPYNKAMGKAAFAVTDAKKRLSFSGGNK